MVDDTRALVDDPGFIATVISAGSGEESITQYLAGLLRDPGILRAYLGELVPGLGDVSVDEAVVCAEDEECSERGRPDISIVVGSRLMVIVENKLGAAFTNNQPHEYFNALLKWKREHPSGTAALAIHAPDPRLTLLTQESWERVSRFGLERDGDSCGGVLVRFVGWSSVERALAAHRSAISEPVLAYLLRSFLHLLPTAVQAVSQPLTKEHVMHLADRTVLEAFANAEDLVWDIRALLNREHKSEIKSGIDGASIAFWPKCADGKPDRRKEFYVGLYARVGAKFGISPLLIQLTGEDYINIDAIRQSGRRVVEGNELAVFNWVERPAIPLEVQSDVDPPAQANRLVAEIEAVRKLALGI